VEASTSGDYHLRIPIIPPPYQPNPQPGYNAGPISPYQQQFNMSIAQQAEMVSHYQMQMWQPPRKMNPVNGYPVHPDVKFRKLPFYEIISELIKPSTIDNRDNRMHGFQFNLTPQEVKTINNEQDIASVSTIGTK